MLMGMLVTCMEWPSISPGNVKSSVFNLLNFTLEL